MPYTLVIAEKPSAAKRIATALAEDKVEEVGTRGVKSYKFTRKDRELIVAPAVGHLFILSEKKSGTTWTYPVFDVEWKPTFENGNSALWSRKYYENIKDLAKKADGFIASCDYDIEGSTIAFNILKYICNTEKASRMKFSTLTKGDLEEAFDKASKDLDFPQIHAGLARHTLDFYYGINLSRALTMSLRAAGGYKTLSTGRVQGPTLSMLGKREKEIAGFKPTPFWQLELNCIAEGNEVLAMHENDKFWKKEEAAAIHDKCNGKGSKVLSIDSRQNKQNPPFPFDLTTLQRESYRNFGYSPKMTLDLAQNLYEQALISYPRTSSQQLTPKLGFKTILKNLGNQKDYGEMCERLLKLKELKPNNGKKNDPAHPAIYPTGQRPKGLNSYQKKVYDLIVKRFLSVFGQPAIRESMKVAIGVEGEKFIAEGIRTVDPQWMEFYMPYARFKESVLPKMEEGQELEVRSLNMLDKETQPPKRFTQAAVLKEMESHGLGTKATRAQILETLYDRGYIEDKQITVTRLGSHVISSLEKYAPDVISIELTRDFEEQMELIQKGKKKWEDVTAEAKKRLEKTLGIFKDHEKDIGKELLQVVIEQHRKENTVGKCKCGGNLIVRRSRKGARFIGCDSYPKCTETFSLPHSGMLHVLKETCATCGLNVVQVKAKGKRPWKLCVRCGFVNARKKKDDGSANDEIKTGTRVKKEARPKSTKVKKPRKAASKKRSSPKTKN